MSAFHFANLTPDLILDALPVGLYLESGLTPLNSYENRVYQFLCEDQRRYVVKFYRPERWSAQQILEEHGLTHYLSDNEVKRGAAIGARWVHFTCAWWLFVCGLAQCRWPASGAG